MRKAKKLIAGIMLACMFIAGTGVEPPDVYAAGTTAGSLEMKTASDSINLNAGQSFDVTFSVNAETSGFGGWRAESDAGCHQKIPGTGRRKDHLRCRCPQTGTYSVSFRGRGSYRAGSRIPVLRAV